MVHVSSFVTDSQIHVELNTRHHSDGGHGARPAAGPTGAFGSCEPPALHMDVSGPTSHPPRRNISLVTTSCSKKFICRHSLRPIRFTSGKPGRPRSHLTASTRNANHASKFGDNRHTQQARDQNRITFRKAVLARLPGSRGKGTRSSRISETIHLPHDALSGD